MQIQSLQDKFHNAVNKSMEFFTNNGFLNFYRKILWATNGRVLVIKKVTFGLNDERLENQTKVISREMLTICPGHEVLIGDADMQVEGLGTFEYVEKTSMDDIPDIDKLLEPYENRMPDLRLSFNVKDMKIAMQNMGGAPTITLNVFFDREKMQASKNYTSENKIVVTPWDQSEYHNMAIVSLADNAFNYEGFENNLQEKLQFKIDFPEAQSPEEEFKSIKKRKKKD